MSFDAASFNILRLLRASCFEAVREKIVTTLQQLF